MSDRPVFSVLGLFDSPQLLLKAIPGVKTAARGRLEAYTPYPIHGIDKLLELKKSPIAGMVLVMGAIGAVTALGLQFWTSGWDYPLVTAGKPVFSWQAFIPIMFELTVLFAAFTAGLGMLLLLNRLPYFRHPMLRAKSMPKITRDSFALAVESDGEALDVEKISGLFREAGASAIEIIEAPPSLQPASPRFFLHVFLAVGISCMTAGYITYWAMKLFPVLPPMAHMLNQPRLDPQRADDFFKDGFGMRMPVAGTVSLRFLPYTLKDQEAASILENPLPRTKEVLNRGRQLFNDHCSVCHGLLGDGRMTLTAAYEAKPANLHAKNIVALTDGAMYQVLMKGKNSMPSYAPDLSQEERWMVLHYIRVIQRALDAKDADVASAGK
jgi:mono/diheme cytochrome c family protein